MDSIRQQLSLFIEPPSTIIEEIRSIYNPKQYRLIPAHITLCREDELQPLNDILLSITTLSLKEPLQINLDPIERFANGKGVLIPATKTNIKFDKLRALILGEITPIKKQWPHVTLMHPRNSRCDDKIFAALKKYRLPTALYFTKISLIVQKNSDPWKIIDEFTMV